MKLARLVSRRVALVATAVALLAGFAFTMTRAGPLAPTRVTVQAAQVGTVAPALFGLGTVEARRAYLVGPTAAGRVARVLVDVGDLVKAGQLLAEIDPVDLDQRIAALDASIARGASAAAGAQAQRQDALARRDLAAATARRYQDLGRQNFLSASAVEGKLQESASASATLAAAEANVAAALQDRQRLAAERAGLLQQRQNARLVAPADALVTGRDAEPGSTVVAGQAVLRLVDPDSLWVKVRFDQGRAAGLAPGQAASIALRSNPAHALPGRIARLEAVSDSVTEERLAQVTFDAAPAGLAIGDLAEVTVTLPAGPAVLVVPNASIRQQGDRTGVWLADGGRPRFAPVRVGPSALDGRVAVLAGLNPGDPVVVHSEQELGARSRIKVVDAVIASRP
ncbi:efflux RND transporter periplasmic adaptor subunit [Ramlibacter sp.]|uniref:efflux RND transporter periplasmic adaptor subunit n=1 Tax=Ramlibacter sp. TaxID=1917967 RepID=UPI002C044E85|nr:efflux RND transporter periplasmic adaptor subunit [Ramlibacter sp.]HWI84608.1 efflux RND transporter periplasmic adaptor subunit [Ramlibacter sp.]